MTEYLLSIWQRDKEEFMQDVFRPGSSIVVREVLQTENLIGYVLTFHDDQDLLFFKLKYPQMKIPGSNSRRWVTQNA